MVYGIVVPIKQVPDMSQVKFETDKGIVDRGSADAEINPFDLYALEAAVQIKDKLGGVITGEHGLGVIRLPDLDLCPGGKVCELMRGIKRVFDPKNILSPGIGLL